MRLVSMYAFGLCIGSVTVARLLLSRRIRGLRRQPIQTNSLSNSNSKIGLTARLTNTSQIQDNKELEYVQNELKVLREIILKHNDNYYRGYEDPVWLDLPPISDTDYDALVLRAEELEGSIGNQDSDKVSTAVGSSQLSRKFSKHLHKTPMLSLSNAFDIHDITKFTDRVNKELNSSSVSYVVEPKIDGFSLSLTYIGGSLVKAATRGDGSVGEDVTLNAIQVRDIPLTIPLTAPIDTSVKQLDKIEIRGEVYIRRSDFAKLNSLRESKNDTLYSTPRNTAAGSLRQPDPAVTKERNLRFFAYSIHNLDDGASVVARQSLALKLLEQLGFQVAQPWCGDVDADPSALYSACLGVGADRDSLDFDIDGAVIKVDNVHDQLLIGMTHRYPKWAVAYKFASKSSISTLLSIDVQVGRTGVLTPVAKISPVVIGGVTVESASLHNEAEVNRLQLCLGDKVIVERCGDVIPKITAVVPMDTGDLGPAGVFARGAYALPQFCPSCGGPTERLDGGVLVRCGASGSCSAQLIENISHFTSRAAADIAGLGRATISELYELGYISTTADIYTLHEKIASEAKANNTTDKSASLGLKSIKGWGEKSVANLLHSIEKRRIISFPKFLFGLGIRYVGEQTARDIADTFGSIESLTGYIDACRANDRLENINGIGPKASDGIKLYFENKQNRERLQSLLELVTVSPVGVSQEKLFKSIANENSIPLFGGSIFEKRVVAFTYKFSYLSRDEAKSFVEENGGVVATSVNKKVNLLILGDKMERKEPSSKLSKAIALGIEVWDSSKFKDIVDNSKENDS